MSNKHDSKVSKVYQVGDEPTYSKVDKVYVVNQSGSGITEREISHSILMAEYYLKQASRTR